MCSSYRCIDVMKAENLVENAAKVGTHLLEELKGFKGIKEVRGRGLMIGMEFEEPIKELRQKFTFRKKKYLPVSSGIQRHPFASAALPEHERSR